MSYQDFYNKYIGKRVAYPPLPTYECVSLVKQYLDECFGIKPGSWGDAKYYWLATNPTLLKRFNKIGGIIPKQGDIIILKPTIANKYGHIAIAHDSTTMLEQNGSTGTGIGTGNDAIRLRTIPIERLYGVLRPKVITKEPTDMYKNQTAKSWHDQAESWHKKFEQLTTDFKKSREEISLLRQTILALTDELNRANKSMLELKKGLPLSDPEPAIEPTEPAAAKPNLLHKLILAVLKLTGKTT